jgi:hypothetical protein
LIRRATGVGLAAAAIFLELAVPTSFGGGAASYPIHTRVTATVFWIGEPQGNGSSESNAISAWDDAWRAHYGGSDDPSPLRRTADGYFPRDFTPKENPFYVDLPYNDFGDNGDPRPDRLRVVPWAGDYTSQLALFEKRRRPFSVLKNRWVKVMREGRVCYAQWEDTGPYRYADAAYVFGANDRRPRSRLAQSAGMDVSPAVRDCLAFRGLNNDENKVAWQFVDAEYVPPGPWRRVVTTRQVFWR